MVLRYKNLAKSAFRGCFRPTNQADCIRNEEISFARYRNHRKIVSKPWNHRPPDTITAKIKENRLEINKIKA